MNSRAERFHCAWDAHDAAGDHTPCTAAAGDGTPSRNELALEFPEGPGRALEEPRLLTACETLTGELVLDRLVAKLVAVCRDTARAARTVLLLDCGDGLVVRASADAGGEVALEDTPLAGARGLPASVIEHAHASGETIVLRERPSEGRFAGDTYLVAHCVRALLALPLRREGRRLGVLYCEPRSPADAFSADCVRALQRLAGSAGISLENGSLFAEWTRAEASARLLAHAGVALAESLDHRATLESVARLVVPELCDWCTVDLLDAERVVAAASAHADPATAQLLRVLHERHPLEVSSSHPAAQALRTRGSVHLPDVDEGTLAALCFHAEPFRALNPQSAVALPLIARGRVLGVLTLASAQRGRFGARELALSEELARRMALALDNARLYRESQDAIGLRDELLAIASHELRTPVHLLNLVLHDVRAGELTTSPARMPGLLELAERQIARMTRLLDEMLSVGRIHAGRMDLDVQPMDLVAVVREVMGDLEQDLTKAGCSLRIRVPAALPGRWDRAKLEQVTTNLLSNAMKFGGGKMVEICIEQQGDQAALLIRDHGIGIPADRLPHIFERFERAVPSREYGGIGLGLYIVRAIVAAHGGSVRAESSLGRGATFIVILPCSGPAA